MERTRIERYCDILVVGGGLPGVCAAIAAGRMGMNVILVERGTTLGGNCGPEVGVCPSDGHRFHPYLGSTGIVAELIEEAAHQNAKTISNWHLYNISLQWDTVMATALKKAGVTLLRRHYAVMPEMDGDRIAAVHCEDIATYHPVRIHVKHFVIDASGDGNISAAAGAKWRQGRESKEEYGERSGQEIADRITMGTSLVCLIRKTNQETPFYPPEGTPPFHPSYRGMTPFNPKPEDECSFFYPCETGGDLDTIEDDHAIYERLVSQLYSAWNRFKNVTHVEEAKNWDLTWVSARTAKRESRRFVGDYTLTQTDLENGKVFDDAIAIGGFAMDIHDPRPENKEYIKITYYSVPPVYSIPYRCTYSVNIPNLFFASRLLSVTHLAHGSVRVQQTLATIGHSVGTAAALCIQLKMKTPRELLPHIQVLQNLLSAQDASIPLPTAHMPGDIAPLAKVDATAALSYRVPKSGKWENLNKSMGIELWNFEPAIRTVSFLLKNNSNKAQSVKARLMRYAPQVHYVKHGERRQFDYITKWPMEIEWGAAHQKHDFKEICAIDATLPAGYEGYLPFQFNAEIEEKNFMNDDDRLLVLLDPINDVDIKMSDEFLEYVRSIEGEKDGEYLAFPRSCCYQIDPAPLYGEPEQAVDTMNRRYSTMPCSMWRTCELPATFSLTWDAPHVISSVDLTFDTFTRTIGEMPFEKQILPASPQCPTEYTLRFFKDGTQVDEVHIAGNYHRFCQHPVNLPFCDRMTITLEKTQCPDQIAGLYRIAVYSPQV